jgi:uncharacterized protein YhbP (UPF0306 family)
MSDLERAASIIRAGRYLTLATADDEGPWAAPVAYSLHGDAHIYFYTGTVTRHFRHLSAAGIVAGAVFDSTVPNVDADGVQFLAAAEEVQDAELDAVMERYFHLQFPDAADRAMFEAPREFFVAPAQQRFVRLRLTYVAVPDLSAYEVPEGEPKIDAHVPVDVAALAPLLADGRP